MRKTIKAPRCVCGESDTVHRTDGPCHRILDPVEEKIQWLIDIQKQEVKKAYEDGVVGNGGGYSAAQWTKAFCELIALVRKESRG